MKRLFEYYLKLAEKDMNFAQSYIASAYYFGWGCSPDYNKFVEWDTVAAKNGCIKSVRRMFLHYFSVGNMEAAATLFVNNRYDIMPPYSCFYTKEAFTELFGGKDMEFFLDYFKKGTDKPTIEENDFVAERKEVISIYYAFCNLYGFGIKQNIEEAYNLLAGIDASRLNEKWRFDLYNSLFCVSEAGYPVKQSLLFDLADDMNFDYFICEEEDIGHLIRHAIYLADNGYEIAAKGLGHLMNSKTILSSYREKAKYIYQDEKEALKYYKMLVEKKEFEIEIGSAIALVCDVESQTFDYEYGKELCINTINKLVLDDSTTYPILSAATGLIELAKFTKDVVEKNKLCNVALQALYSIDKYQPNGVAPKYIGIIYFDILKDYASALPWFEKASDGNDVSEYLKKCKQSKKGCYVATCVYGTYDCPELWTLRRYRDERLSETYCGRRFITLYYAVSPFVVKVFGEQRWFNYIMKKTINIIVECLQKRGISSEPYKDK